MSFARAVLWELTWRKTAVMLALGFSMPTVFAVLGLRAIHLSLIPVLMASAMGNLVIALIADEAVKRGGALRRTYALAIPALLVIHCVLAEGARAAFDAVITPNEVHPDLSWTGILRYGLDQSLWGVFALFVYLNRRVAQRMLQAVHEAELRRIQLEAQLVESRLAAAQAQVDPKMLFGALGEVRHLLDAASPDAEQRLDRLIQRLRNTLASTVVGEVTGDRA